MKNTKHYQSSIGGFSIHLVLVGGSMSSISKSLTHSSKQKTKYQKVILMSLKISLTSFLQSLI